MALTLAEERRVPLEDRPKYYGDKEVHYLDMDVLTAAKLRIKECLLAYDVCCVNYSGGKDSEVVLHLVRTVMDEMGWTQPLDVVFRDEELIPEDVINHILRLRAEPEKWNLHYFAFPMKSHYFILGKHTPYVQWDEARRGNWMRDKPEGAIEQVHPENRPLDQKDTNLFINLALGWGNRRVGVFNGVRCQESLHRFMSCIATKNRLNYLSKNTGGVTGTDLIKCIYDWSEDDIFRYFYDFDVPYAKVYDTYMFARAPLRVATPVHDNGFQQLEKLRVTYPKFYEQILNIWPEIDVQQRYWSAYDQMAAIKDYPKSFTGIFQYIDDHVDAPLREKAKKAVTTCRNFKEKNKRMGRFEEACYGYPILYVFEKTIKGAFLRGITSNKNPAPEHLEYERQAEVEARGGSILTD